jgi:hypothetical protein
VLEDFGFGGGVGVGGLRRGFTCRLGQFVPMSPADVEELELLKEGGLEQRAIETTSIELPDEPGGDPPAEAEAEDAAPAEEN